MSNLAIICVTVALGIYALALVALVRLEYKPLREPRRDRDERMAAAAAESIPHGVTTDHAALHLAGDGPAVPVQIARRPPTLRQDLRRHELTTGGD